MMYKYRHMQKFVKHQILLIYIVCIVWTNIVKLCNMNGAYIKIASSSDTILTSYGIF